jgi:hypothetical protein
MAKKNKQDRDNSIVLCVKIDGKETEAAKIDSRKFELINYYVRQKQDSDKTTEEQLKQLVQSISSAVTEAIDNQYKKYVPKAVREMYDNLISQSVTFGAKPSESNENLTEQDEQTAPQTSPVAFTPKSESDESRH